jgi:hypothetical protein
MNTAMIASPSPIRRKMALLTGISLLLMAVSAGVAYGYAFQGFHVQGDAALTLQKAQAQPWLLPVAAVGFGWVLLLDLVVSVALLRFYQAQFPRASKWLAALRVLYSLLLGFALLQLFSAWGEAASADASADALLSRVDSFLVRWSAALIVFGLHLMLWGWMSLKSGETPKVLALLALFAGFCYFAHHGLNTFVGGYAAIGPMVEKVLALPMALGELLLAIWMMVRGGKARKVSATAPAVS